MDEAETENNVMKLLSPEVFEWANITKGKGGTAWDYLLGIIQDEHVLHCSAGDEQERREKLKELHRKKKSKGVIIYDDAAKTTQSGECPRVKKRAKRHAPGRESSILVGKEHEPLSQTIERPRINAAMSMPAIDLGLIGQDDGDFPIPVPQNVKDHAEGLGGNEVGLVFEKYLTKSDTLKGQNRLLMPVSKMKWPSFLREDERKFLETRASNDSNILNGLSVLLLEPTMTPEQCNCKPICLKRWEMKKEDRKTSTVSYVLSVRWYQVVVQNSLKISDLVRVWSFRVGSDLHLALTVAGA